MDDLYANYKADKYTHFRTIRTGEYEKQKVKSAKKGERMKPIMKKVEVPFEEVKNLRLDKIGRVAPTLDTEDFTIISNYLVDFWGAVMGNCPVDVYMHLKRHAYGKKDYCYIDIEMVALKMGRSVNAVKGYISTLEEYGFVVQFNRMAKDDSLDTSPLFKIRRYIPMLTQEMYDSLHPKLKKEHDKFMKQFEDINFSGSLINSEVGELVNDGRVINNKSIQEKIEKVIQEGQLQEYIMNTMSIEQIEINEKIHIYMKEKISKPSYETWIGNTVFLLKSNMKVHAFAPSEFARDWLANKYSDIIREYAISELGLDETWGSVDVFLAKEYLNEGTGRG
jgi:hypothetical protein